MVERKLLLHQFFTEEEKGRIVRAIREAEGKSSGEIRVYLERRTKGETLERAKKIFERLGMTKTRERNGVLVYLSLFSHQFSVLGDRGIHEKVGLDFWRDVVHLMETAFAQGRFVEGLEVGIQRIGEKLKTHFPWTPGDVNELSDEIG